MSSLPRLALASLTLIVSAAAQSSSRTPVLVELFTSEGCSSCPPADALLARLLTTQPVPAADVIVLEEHVDYWDSLGWHDRFSSPFFTDRQSAYTRRLRLDSNYTPQMIVDGTDEFVGNDSAHASRAIAHAAAAPKSALTLSELNFDSKSFTGAVSAGPGLPASTEVFAALVEPMASTEVRGGENGGRTLRHVSVARSIVPLGKVGASLNFKIPLPKDLSRATARLVVFAQQPNHGAILAVVASCNR